MGLYRWEWANGHPWTVAVYLIELAGITLVSVWLAGENHQFALHEGNDQQRRRQP